MGKEGTKAERTAPKTTAKCFLDYSNEALQRIIEDPEIVEALSVVRAADEHEGNVLENIAMLADFEKPGSMYEVASRSDSVVREQWTEKIPTSLLEKINDLVKDLPDKGVWRWFDSFEPTTLIG